MEWLKKNKGGAMARTVKKTTDEFFIALIIRTCRGFLK